LDNEFKHILEPLHIGKTRVPNRIALSPINTSFGSITGDVTKRLIEFHRAIAHGQVGLTIIGSTAVSKDGRVNYYGLLLDSEDKIASFRMLFEAVEKEGSLPAIQLMHAGRQTFPDVTGRTVVAPSNVPSPNFSVVPKELTVDEIAAVIESFAEASIRAKRAGARLIELHGAHGYLIEQFLSPFSNKRKDEYGGSLKNRVRFFCEIIAAIKSKLGSDFPIICRIGVDEFRKGGISRKESIKVAEFLVRSGVDGISVTAGIYGEKNKIYPVKLNNQRIRFRAAMKMKELFDIPIICGGRIANLYEAETILKSGQADMVGMARALIADPNLVRKSVNREKESIVNCNWCNECIYDFRKHQRLKCSLNPFL
jgi:2,4-dienoyl-CoA reductase-like NADH-dependent reductase (Old Yellow Enzyme family)